MSSPTALESDQSSQDPPDKHRNGPGQWLLTWAGVFTAVIALMIVFAVTIVILSQT